MGSQEISRAAGADITQIEHHGGDKTNSDGAKSSGTANEAETKGHAHGEHLAQKMEARAKRIVSVILIACFGDGESLEKSSR
ncbi:hypothetical protein GCM10023156_41170 [Novipirellula rosea]|uniref:Uncharacterized protein n=1 Tax=Novipirellula rosea TaxID=1031540 RepID=A0ABP8N5L7_9BACT